MIFMSWNVKELTNPISCQYGKLDFLSLQEVQIFNFNMECACSLFGPIVFLL